MPGNSFGELFRITTWGESHGGALGAVVDGCPAGLKLSEKDIQPDLDRRRPGQSRITSGRREDDRVEILSGVFGGITLGTPISLLIRNKDARSGDYAEMKEKYRPSHADYTYQAKYSVRNWQGGGRASARETAARVAAGAIAKKILAYQGGVEIVAWVDQLGADLKASVDADKVRLKDIEKNIVRCPNQTIAKKMIGLIEKVRSEGDTIGGKVKCVARNVQAGLGEPVFDKLHADLAKAMVSLPAVRGFEIGSGLDSLEMKGSEHNDPFEMRGRAVRTSKNDSGGIQGGISNGENILVSVTFKPVATIFKKQKTVTTMSKETVIMPRGRHDPCVLPRAVVLVEAMMALVLCDHFLRNKVARMK